MRTFCIVQISALLCRSKSFLYKEICYLTRVRPSTALLLFSGLFTSSVCSSCFLHEKRVTQPSTAMTNLCADFSRHNIQILKNLGVIEGKTMDVIVAGVHKDANEHVIFFGGDVQDYPEEMLSHRDNGKYLRWNSLATAGRLCERFPGAMVLLVKPHQMHLKTFSVYSQFVQSNDFGVPVHSSNYGAWQALITVYKQAVFSALQENVDSEKECHSGSDKNSPSLVNSCSMSSITHTPVHLIGFSKGCVVLNQLVHELKSVKEDKEAQEFLSRISVITWLDGGHSGGSSTWVTDQTALHLLSELKVDIHVHVTPYQVKDELRSWIGKEKRRFVEILRKAHAKITDTLHFEDEPKSIENHFKILEVF